MAKISTDMRAGVLHPREDIYAEASLGALNAEVIIDADGSGTVSLDLRGTFNMTIEVSGTVDGDNWVAIPVKPVGQASKSYVAAVTGSTAGVWVGSAQGFRRVRARVTAYTSGSAVCNLLTSQGILDQSLDGTITPIIVTATGAAAAAVTLSLPSPGAGLRHYITYLSANRFASAALTAGAAPTLVTTTNIPGALVLSLSTEGAAQGVLLPWREDFAYPVAVSSMATATTIVAPATTGVIWRLTAGYYVAP